MSLNDLANNAVQQIRECVSAPLTESELSSISTIINETLIKTVGQATNNCREAAVICCGPEADIAHKIAHEINQAQKVLITNLTAMR